MTVEDAANWIKERAQSLIENNERNKYYSKLGLLTGQNGKGTEQNEKMDVEKSFSNGDISLNFLVNRSSDQIRQGYIDRLVAKGIMKTEPSKKYQSSTQSLMKSSFTTGMIRYCAQATSVLSSFSN